MVLGAVKAEMEHHRAPTSMAVQIMNDLPDGLVVSWGTGSSAALDELDAMAGICRLTSYAAPCSRVIVAGVCCGDWAVEVSRLEE